eukprot:2409370-Pyramimonas_sp.AAC.1
MDVLPQVWTQHRDRSTDRPFSRRPPRPGPGGLPSGRTGQQYDLARAQVTTRARHHQARTRPRGR